MSETYRHELKYPIDMGTYLSLRQRLRTVMKTDSHAGADGRYIVHSIYFDNADDKALREKINGVARRENGASAGTTMTWTISCWKRRSGRMPCA